MRLFRFLIIFHVDGTLKVADPKIRQWLTPRKGVVIAGQQVRWVGTLLAQPTRHFETLESWPYLQFRRPEIEIIPPVPAKLTHNSCVEGRHGSPVNNQLLSGSQFPPP